MQTPIRYYITKADDRPVVRTIPVALRPTEAIESPPTPHGQPAPQKTHEEPERCHDQARVRRLVRSAMGR